MAATWDIESGMGRALSLVQLICKKVRQLGGTQADVDRLVKEEGEPTLDQITRLIVGKGEVAPDSFPTWKRIRLGVCKSAAEYIEALQKQGCRISDHAADILGQPQFTVAPEETEVDLVQVTAAEFGFKNGGTLAQIYAAAKARGLELCHAEVGPALRLQYPGQPLGEWLLVAMEPIRDSDGCLHVFRVEPHVYGRWLCAGWGSPARVWGAGFRWLFRRK